MTIYHNECLISRDKCYNGNYSIIMLHDYTLRTSSEGLLITKETLKKLIRKPYIVKTKDDVPYFKIGLVTKESIRTTKPIEKYTRLIIDYDNENKDRNLLRKFKKKFKDYSYMLYTTFSSTEWKPKFRVILKLKGLVDSSFFDDKCNLSRLVKEFTVDGNEPDESCFMNYQFQCLPCVKKGNEDNYLYVFNKGKEYDLGSEESCVKQINMVDLMLNVNARIDTIVYDNNRQLEIVDKLKRRDIIHKSIDDIIKRNTSKTKEDYYNIIVNAKYKHRFDFIRSVGPLFKNRIFTLEEVKEMCRISTSKELTGKHITKLLSYSKYLEEHNANK